MTLLLSPIMLVGSKVGRRKYCQANLSHPGLSPACQHASCDVMHRHQHHIVKPQTHEHPYTPVGVQFAAPNMTCRPPRDMAW